MVSSGIRYGRRNCLVSDEKICILESSGDSYYGIAEQIPVLKAFYQLIFQISDYTRNGLFFAPVFFLMGGKMADWRKSRLPDSAGISFRACAAGFCISAGLMSAEAMLLRNYQIKRHDSMYLFLLPCMFFLFQLLLQWNNRSKKRIPASLLRSGSLILYIIHPMMIVALRLAAKVLHVEPLLLENSMIHYISVCLLSILCSVIALFLRNIWRRKFHSGRCITGSRFKAGQNSASGASCRRIKGRYGKCPPGTDRAWIELNVNHLKHNVKVLQKALPKGSELMAVVKDHAYGHGAFEISTQLNRMGIKAFAVAGVDGLLCLDRAVVKFKGKVVAILILPLASISIYKPELVHVLVFSPVQYVAPLVDVPYVHTSWVGVVDGVVGAEEVG